MTNEVCVYMYQYKLTFSNIFDVHQVIAVILIVAQSLWPVVALQIDS